MCQLSTENLLRTQRAPGCRGFMHDNFSQSRTLRRELLPKPSAHVFNGRVLKSRNLVQVAMIHPLQQWPHRLGNIGMIIKPAGRRIALPFHRDFHFKTVPVHPAALMSLRCVGQGLCSLEGKILGQTKFHRLTEHNRRPPCKPEEWVVRKVSNNRRISTALPALHSTPWQQALGRCLWEHPENHAFAKKYVASGRCFSDSLRPCSESVSS